MPEMLFQVRWPDGSRETCYSPSTVIADHLEAGRAYTVQSFVEACRGGLGAASDRVAQVYGGSGCSRAAAQLAAIERKAKGFSENDTIDVEGVGAQWRRSA